MEDFNTPETTSTEDSFGKVLGKEFAIAAAATAGCVAGYIAVTYIAAAVLDRRMAKQEKKAAKKTRKTK